MIHKPTGLKFKTKPWQHQLKALQYLMGRDFSALYTDPGTGKTKVMIDLINNKDFNTTLIVCPKKAMDVWEQEFSKHSLNQNIQVLNTKDMTVERKSSEVKKINSLQLKIGQPMVIIINYDSIWRQPLKQVLLKMKFDAIICDESHRIKSPSSKVSKFLTALGRRSSHRYLVTGTPLSQSPLDIYAQYRFLNPEIFGTRFDDFKYQYANFVKANGYEFIDKKKPYKNLDELHEKMFSCAFHDKSSVVLPPTQDIIVDFQLPPKIQKYYSDFKKESCLEFEDGDIIAENVLSSILRLQQLCSGYLPIIDENNKKITKEIDNTRINVLKDLVEDFEADEPLVIFCKYRKDINDVLQLCKDMKISVSEVSGKKDELKAWKDGWTRVIVVQIKAGAESIDLTRARYCIYYNLDYSLINWTQSRKRVHRPNQKHSVVYYILVAKHKKCKTIDEKILESLENNLNVVQSIMEDREI